MSAEMYGDEWNPDLTREDEPREPRYCPCCGNTLPLTGRCPWCDTEDP